ncbi:4-diphosphocytidyl-2-C-methyl-D-erythritol kinase [Streptococcus parauberis]|uniref:4-(cytidine 5'-diphospho)-2-C-methyl-D-erythritol kinase n=1 Tax=Streptococcus parauberis TaxID=1348 RepID=UPI000CCECEDB|nr:4-(cytidine 5'-diphospho)-2-C-methyl-D-erythritol kinase [Streptococcus parauberis]PNY21929.1 4-diphosphocytidyl-2-C-methyl-D-erythritol kinase [Streptococcus parauberis]
MVSIIERAPAKINLGLDVLGKRDDGYHDLSMVMVSVDLCDYITLSDREDNKIVITSNSPKMPVNDKNDVFKAAQLIKADYGIKKGVSINLDKKIPICAGMGGGSSDAAATIRGLNKLWQLNLTKEEMIAIGKRIGSDVPYCISGGCAQVGGMGEQVDCIDGKLSSWVVLVKPEFGISTRTIFSEVDCQEISRVDISAIINALETNNYQALITSMGNSLENISITRKPFIQKIKDKMIFSGADVALMTGSGPTVFALCRTEKQANRAVNSLKGFCKEVYKVRTL